MEGFFGALSESEGCLPLLEDLSLANTGAGEGIESLTTALVLKKMPKLRSLDLSSCRLTDRGVGLLGEALGGIVLPRLASLCLHNSGYGGHDRRNDFGLEGLRRFFQALQRESVPNLRYFKTLRVTTACQRDNPLWQARQEGKLKWVDR
eukprot:Cvel_17155.t2-p1 / transcript=Cvel_17155.t2 / gene=Cvel_17155 / organism=Chromera_velia_CCMP2878 / gene_product=hypothetical protein / transcript_product=hypothetical protein / location=Cvel_scaffold1355:41654-42097(-) / protein_length=148 / sequence_SO=supercontig / SO=protein_coding / is_pseudo=false